MARERARVDPTTVVIPINAVLEVRSSAQMSRDGISDDYEGYRHKGREYGGNYCGHEGSIGDIDRKIALVKERVLLLREGRADR